MTKSKSITKPTLAGIADELGLSERRISQLKQEGMPVDSIDAAKAWRRAREAETTGSNSADGLRREKIKLTKAQAERADLLLEIARGKYISRKESNDSDASIAHAVAAMLKRWEAEIPALCHGLPLAKALGVYREKSRELQTLLGDLQSEFWSHYPEREK